jgi:SAM-dependent methyltransferase
MRPEHLDYLACPRCMESLQLEASDVAADGHVLEGTLTCVSCSTQYPLTRGTPCLLPDPSLRSFLRERTAERFGYEWNQFSTFNYDEEEASLKTWFRPRRLEDLEGLAVLEAGCGMGRHATIACHYGVKALVGLDLGNAVEAAFQNTRHFPAVCIVQGDIYYPPLKHKAFDAAFSLGVLHHLPDPGRGFQALGTMVRDDGWIQIWVYGREGNGWILYLIDPIRRVTSRMPMGLLRQLSLLVAVPLLLGARTLYQTPWLGRRLPYSAYVRWLAAFSLRKVHAIVLDHALTPVAHYLSRGDVERLVQQTGWTIVELEHNRSMSWGLCARRVSVPGRNSCNEFKLNE